MRWGHRSCCRQARDFLSIDNLRLKGWSRPVAAFRPGAISRPLHFKVVRRTIGRDRERGILRHALDKLKGGVGGTVCIEGEAGIGKSTLLSDVIESARAAGLCTLHGVATAVDRATPYFAWREVLAQLFAPSGAGTGNQLEARLSSEGDRAELCRWLPLLEDIMPLGWKGITSRDRCRVPLARRPSKNWSFSSSS